MLKKLIILFFVSASVYFASGIVEDWSHKNGLRIKEMKDLYADQVRIEKRIDEIENRRDELESTMVRYMRGVDKRLDEHEH